MVCKVSDTLPQANHWASSHIRAHFPRPTSLLRPENYDFLALNAESGNNVIQFARRSSGSGKRVSGTVEGHGLESGLSHATDPSGGIRTLACRALKRECTVTTKQASLDSEYQASPADSSISHKRKNGTYNNGPRHSGKTILCFVAVFAGFWLGVAAVSAYVHFSGR